MIFQNLTKKVLKMQKYLLLFCPLYRDSFLCGIHEERWYSYASGLIFCLRIYVTLCLNTDCTNLLHWHSCPSVILAVYDYQVPASPSEELLFINKVNVHSTRNMNTILSSAKEHVTINLIDNCTLLSIPQSMQYTT